MEEIKQWILNQQTTLDQITSKASRKFWELNKSKRNFGWDLLQSHSESYELVRGRDLCYDRITTPFTYTLWYHPRRINTFLSFFLDKILNLDSKELQLFDLGAGTGAVQWSLMLVVKALEEHGYQTPKIKIVNIDTSPFMLYYNKDYLWQYFLEAYNLSGINYEIDYEINSWNNTNPESKETIISSSYLFDASDNKEEIIENFKGIVKTYNPSALLLITSRNKKRYLDALAKEFLDEGYFVDINSASRLLYNQPLTYINQLRKELSMSYPDIGPLTRTTRWSDPGFSGVAISKKQSELFLVNSNPIKKLSIFSPPIRVITEIKLNENQIKASKYSETPSVVIGPAGCGKSIVIAEKIFNTVVKHDYNKQLRILVTTFNKSLIAQLRDWLVQLFDKDKISITNNRLVSYLRFTDSNVSNITLLHFDILPRRLGNVPFYGFVSKSKNDEIMLKCIDEIKKENEISNSVYDSILNVDFLNEEYHRVIYGLQVGLREGKDKYYKITRIGRGSKPSMPKNGIKRKLVFACLKKYAIHLYQNNIPHFTIRRQRLLFELNSNISRAKYDYLFVDEFQDCTRADFQIFNLLLNDPDHFTIAGDLAQAVHIGKAARIPRFENMARRQFHRLEGSYRLPIRISEAIQPISEAIQLSFNNIDGVGVITPFKSSPPGARPIVVFDRTSEGIAKKIKEIFEVYSIYDLDRVTILEKDKKLADALNNLGLRSEADTILRLKGLEKRCVIWSTRENIEYEKEVYEFVYTILSRTSSILIIALYNASLSIYKPVIGRLRSDRLIMWDKETDLFFKSFVEKADPEISVDEE